MKPTPFYFFEYLPPGAKKPKRTTYRMTIEDAAQRLAGAVPVLSTEEIRNLPEDADDLAKVSHFGRLYSTKGRPGK
jgi:hypothetical protein